MDVLRQVGTAISNVPAEFNLHPRLNRVLGARRRMIDSGDKVD